MTGKFFAPTLNFRASVDMPVALGWLERIMEWHLGAVFLVFFAVYELELINRRIRHIDETLTRIRESVERSEIISTVELPKAPAA